MDSRRRCFVLIIVFLLLAGWSSFIFAQEDFARETLRGLAGVHVNVELTVSSEIDPKPLSAQIQSDVESKLETMGIKALSKEELFSATGGPLLLVRVDLMKDEKKYLSYILIQLYQHVFLIKGPRDVTYPAVTWSTNGTQAVLYALDDLRGIVIEEGGRFALEFLQANPK
ncbi:MAG: hypothetical protein V1758_08940 [Pseudomonadota bacterium]